VTQQLRRKREKKPLRSLAVLHERSAVPSLTSRAKPAAEPKKISSAEKKRLRRTALKAESDGTAAASMKATDTASLRDPWAAEKKLSLPGGWGDEGVVKVQPKTPETLARQRDLRRAVDAAQLAAELPRAGVSYNPSAPAHAALLEEAIAEEMGLLAAEEREEADIAARGSVVQNRTTDDFADDMVGGMRIGRGDGVEEDSESEGEEEGFKPKPTKRKTQAQRNKAARAKALLLAEREEAQRRKMERHVGAARAMSKSVAARAREVEQAAQQRRAAAAARERLGYAGGEKVGKHRVQKGAVAVQLGEDLAESLRQVKVSA
jgi:nucleolar protein 53